MSDFATPRQPELAVFFHSHAWRDETTGFGRTFVLEGKSATLPILGFYTLFMSKLPSDDFTKEMQGSFPYKAVPVACLAEIARDHRTPKERHIGELLMQDALRRVVRVADEVGCFGVMLFAKTPGLEEYYSQYGFVRLERKPNKNNPSKLMFLPLADVRANM